MSIACKCCGAATGPFACVDYSRTCEDAEAPVFAASGEMVAYLRCDTCGFLFTPHFDGLSAEEMAAKIYNNQYHLADPDFADARPRHYAGLIRDALMPVKDTITALDFGGGGGLLATLLLADGFGCFDSYDPYFGETAMPSTLYDIVTAFEVVEHVRDPIAGFRQALSFLRPDGAVLFSTALQPRHVDTSWWYIGPRNGHVSLHSRQSLEVVARRLGAVFLSIDDGLHMFYRTPPNVAARAIARRFARRSLYTASLRGPWPLMATAWQLTGLGQARAALDPRHIGRALTRR